MNHNARWSAPLTWRRPTLAYLLIVVLPMLGGLALLVLNAGQWPGPSVLGA